MTGVKVEKLESGGWIRGQLDMIDALEMYMRWTEMWILFPWQAEVTGGVLCCPRSSTCGTDGSSISPILSWVYQLFLFHLMCTYHIWSKNNCVFCTLFFDILSLHDVPSPLKMCFSPCYHLEIWSPPNIMVIFFSYSPWSIFAVSKEICYQMIVQYSKCHTNWPLILMSILEGFDWDETGEDLWDTGVRHLMKHDSAREETTPTTWIVFGK